MFSFIVVSIPSSVAAKEPTVEDSYEKEKSTAQTEVEEKEESTTLNPTEDASLVGIIVKLILYTLLIIVLIYGLIKFLALKQKNLQPNQAVKLMGGTPLGNNKSLQLVKVGEHVLLVGVGDQVTLIKEFSSTDEIGSIEKNLDKQPLILTNSITKFIKGKLDNRSKTKQSRDFEYLLSQSLDKQKVKQNQLKHDLSKEDDEKEGNPRW